MICKYCGEELSSYDYESDGLYTDYYCSNEECYDYDNLLDNRDL